MELTEGQKRWLEFLAEASRTDSRIVMVTGRRGPFWTLQPKENR